MNFKNNLELKRTTKREDVLRRGAEAYVMSEYEGMNISEIARHFGKDRSTIYYSIKRVLEDASTDPKVREWIEARKDAKNPREVDYEVEVKK